MYNCIIFTDVSDTLYSAIAIGAYKLAHSLRKNGYTCLVVNHFSHYTDNEFAKIINLAVGDQTKLIGFSTTFLRRTVKGGTAGTKFSDLSAESIFPQGKETEDKFIALCKKKNNNIKMIVGGYKVNKDFKNKNIDYVCIGYAEDSIINVMNHLVHGDPLKNAIKNLWGRTIIDDPKQKSYDFANADFEWLPEDVLEHKVLPIEIGRGCIFQCKFCSFPMNGKQNLDFVKAEELLYQELLSNYERFGITHYRIVDDTFNDHREKINMMSRVIKKLPFQPIFWAYIRLDLLTTRPETISQLYDIGVKGMFFGIESLNSQTAKIVGKGYDCNKQIETIQKIRSNFDISMHGSFIVGLPEESIESSLDSYKRIKTGEIPLHSYTFNPLYINKVKLLFPSEFDRNWDKYGYKEIPISESVDNLSTDAFQSSASYAPPLNWSNSITTYAEVVEITNQIEAERLNSESMYLESEVAIAIHGMGFPEFNFDKLRYLTQRDANLYGIEKVAHKVFLKRSKEKLFKFLENKNAGVTQG
jgi:hypothetical protein